MSLATPSKIRELQIKLYRKAKNEPGYRFYMLYDKIWREDILAHAYAQARANKGAPGVDGQTFEQIESGGLEEWLTGIRQELRNKAQEVRAAIAARMRECGLELHPEKTKIVYCKDDNRWGRYPNEKFDFLGYTFRPRRSKSREEIYFIGFGPAVSDKAVKAIRAEIRSWNLHLRSDKAIEDLSRMFNPIVRGWLQYYGRFYRSALYPPMRQLDRSLARWAYRKYKKLRGHLRRATHWIARLSRRDPKLWAHWQLGVRQGSMVGAV